MNQWMNSLNKRSKGGTTKPKSLVLSIKPCTDDKTFYRFRLLGFTPTAGSDRDDPFIERFVHQHWGVNKEKGYPVLEDEIICPVTPHVKVEGNKYNACKICDLANKYFVAFKDSGWKDKEACKKNKEFGRKYQAIIPVYVVNDPNYAGNNGKFKVIIFNDKKFYTDFRKKVEKASLQNPVFNGENAVDCCIHMTETVQVANEGQPNEYTWKKKEIDKVVFSNKPYDIPAITREACEGMQFDETYYTASTEAEIDAFYKKYCTISNDDIPMDDEVQVYDVESKPEKPQQKLNVQNENAKPIAVPDKDLDDLVSGTGSDMPFDEGSSTSDSAPTAPADNKKNDDIDADELLKDLDL